MNKKYFFVVFLIFGFFGSINAQEVLSGISVNSKLENLSRHNPDMLKSSLIQYKIPVDFIPLPFIDDFTGNSPYPDNYFWSDSDVYINSTFPLNPPSYGVATFDALNKYGHMYTFADTEKFKTGDVLTSRPIMLDPSNKNVVLSFFYEPRGIGDKSGAPLPADTFFLDFYSPETQKWKNIKAFPGDTTQKEDYFHQVFVPITQPEYLQKGFCFRFRNNIHLKKITDPGQNGNSEFWHIDYVQLDADRDTTIKKIRDVAFSRPPKSLVSPYQSLPWEQYKTASFSISKPQIETFLHNNDDTTYSVARFFEIRNIFSNKIVFKGDGGKKPCPPGNFSTLDDISKPFGNFDYDKDQSVYEVRSYINYTQNPKFDKFFNDTVTFLQVFKNYYAYDDGSPERGYGISGEGTENARVAMCFETFTPDSLTGIGFFFNPTYKDTTQSRNYLFNITVWDDNNGIPGNKIYEKLDADTIRYGNFPIYKLDSGILLQAGKFYVGWKQINPKSLNMGFDLNNDNHKQLFYNLGTEWQNSGAIGSLMIRPVFNHTTNTLLNNKTVKSLKVHISPNPASESVYIEGLNDDYPAIGTLYSMTGNIVLQQTLNYDNTIDVSNLATGLYILKITGRKNQYAAVKLMIQH